MYRIKRKGYYEIVLQVLGKKRERCRNVRVSEERTFVRTFVCTGSSASVIGKLLSIEVRTRDKNVLTTAWLLAIIRANAQNDSQREVSHNHVHHATSTSSCSTCLLLLHPRRLLTFDPPPRRFITFDCPVESACRFRQSRRTVTVRLPIPSIFCDHSER